MVVVETFSFIKKILGQNTYEEYRGYARQYIPVATVVLIVVLALTYFFHWWFLSRILNILTGTSLIFIAYIIGVVLLLDYGVEVEMEEAWNGRYKLPDKMPFKYNATKLWGGTLVVLAIAAVYFSNEYRTSYAFECETFLVDENAGIYHIENVHDEPISYTCRMMGYEIKEHEYSFCESCRDWLEDAEEYYDSEMNIRR